MIGPAQRLSIIAACCVLFAGAARAADLPAHTAAPSVALVTEGATPFRIVVRSAKTPAVAFAAGELAKYVAEISGATLSTDSAARPGPRIVIGLRKDLSAADRALLPKPAKGADGYAVAIVAKTGGFPRIVLGGDNPRGVVYGVYDLLERLGCRFVHPALDPNDPEIVPRTRDLTLAAGKWSVASPFKYRALAWFEWRSVPPAELATTPEQLTAQIDWAMKSRYNVFESAAIELSPQHPLARALRVAKQRGMLLQAPGHNFDRFLPNDPKTLAEHPDWFGLRKGKRVGHALYGAQFCWTNQQAQKQFTDAVVAFVRERPDLDILELSVLDGGPHVPPCGCEQCAKRNPTDNLIELMNGVVARLAKTAPNVVVEMLGGYQHLAEPPKEVKPDPRLRVSWAHWGRPIALTYSSDRYARRRAKLDAWANAFNDHLTVFQYYSDYFANSWFTSPLALLIEGDRRYLIEAGIDGMLNLVYPDGYWWRSSLNGYLAGRSFYDPAAEPFVLLREYATSYFGPAGDLMAAYLDEWARDPRLGERSRDQASPEQRTVLAAQRRKYLAPAAALVQAEPLHRLRLEKMAKLHALAETIMDSDIDRREAQELRQQGDVQSARKRLERSRFHLGKAKELAKQLAEADLGLLDREIKSSVFAIKDKESVDLLKALDQPPVSAGPGPRPSPGRASSATGVAPSNSSGR